MSEVIELDWDTRYNKGFDDGYDGHTKNGEDPAYLEGYYDGVSEAEMEDEFSDYYYYDEDDDED